MYVMIYLVYCFFILFVYFKIDRLAWLYVVVLEPKDLLS